MIKALLVGAGTFENSDNTLPCCPNDINEIKKSLEYGLNLISSYTLTFFVIILRQMILLFFIFQDTEK